MKKTSVWFGKAFLSALIALAIATAFCFFYYNLPVHYTNESGATDFVWDPNHISIRGVEGFAFTKTDENGFVNTFPKKKDKVDVLVMGSSHTEGFYVNWNENFTYLLNQKFDQNSDEKYAYSIGASSHNFVRCMKNLEAAVEEYQPEDSIVIETNLIEFDLPSLKQLNSGEYAPVPSYNGGLLHLLQQNDFFRLTYYQVSHFMAKNSSVDETVPVEEYELSEYVKQLNPILEKAGRIGKENDCRIIIVYCPKTELDYNGTMIRDPYSDEEKAFISACEKYNLEFLDLYSAFESEYQESNRLPHGFANTSVGFGHLNASGNNTVAEEIYSVIMKGE